MNRKQLAGTCRAFTSGPVHQAVNCVQQNLIDFSCYRQLTAQLSCPSLSIKYVRSGRELYDINGQTYSVTNNRYLLTNAYTRGRVTIDSTSDVKGICIAISPTLLSEVVSVHRDPARPYAEADLAEYLSTATFFEHDYSARHTNLGNYLEHVVSTLSPNALADELLLAEVFYGLTSNLVADQRELHQHYASFTSVKDSTRKDLLRRLLRGKELMDDCYTQRISITDIARVATMSEYHFLRLFRRTFNSTPHRYIVDKRLQKAAELLLATDMSVTAIAAQCGFADVHAFSKAYKKRYGVSPSVGR